MGTRKSLLRLYAAAFLFAACRPGPTDGRFSTAMARPASPGKMEPPLLAFAWAGDFSEGLAPVEVQGKFGFIDTEGTYRIEPRFGFAGAFSQNRAPVLVDGRWGYTDATGKLMVPARFAWAGSFREDRAPIADSLGYAFIDTNGLMIGSAHYQDVRPYADGLAGVKMGEDEDGAWGFVDRNGEEAVPALFAGIGGGFSEGLAAVTIGTAPPYLTGYIDRSGGFAIDTLYDAGGDFSEGLAPVGRGEWHGNGFRGAWGYVDSTGRLALPLAYSWAGPFSHGRALVRFARGRYASIGRDGKILRAFPPSARVSPYGDDSLAAFQSHGRYGFIDGAGRIAIAPVFLAAGSFHGGRARVRPVGGNGSWSYIDARGRFLGGIGAITSH